MNSLALDKKKTVIRRVFTREDFLCIARMKDSEEDISDVSAEERFYDAVYSELFEDTRHLLLRLDGLYRTDAPEPDISQTDIRLNCKLAAFFHDTHRSIAHVTARLHSAYWQDVATAAYILSSITNQGTVYLDRVLALFDSSEPAFRPAFVTGLKHGKNPRILPCLEEMADKDEHDFISDVHDIVAFRTKYKTGHLNFLRP